MLYIESLGIMGGMYLWMMRWLNFDSSIHLWLAHGDKVM